MSTVNSEPYQSAYDPEADSGKCLPSIEGKLYADMYRCREHSQKQCCYTESEKQNNPFHTILSLR